MNRPPPGARGGRWSGLAGLVAEGDRDADQRAVLGPGAVVVLDRLVAQELLEHEPGVRGPLPDPAQRDGLLAVIETGSAVDLAQLVVGLEGAVVVGGLAPRHVD